MRKLIKLQPDLLTSMTTFPPRALTDLSGIISAMGVGYGYRAKNAKKPFSMQVVSLDAIS